jgi:hypothetical protein
VPAVADRVKPQHLGVLVLGLDQLAELGRDRRPPGVVERGRVVHGGVRVEHAQRGVQVVEARVGQPQAHHRQPEHLGQLRPGRLVAAEAVAGQQHPAGAQDVALALVDLPRGLDPRIAGGAEPAQVHVGLRGPLRVAEPRAEHRPAHHRRPVGREHHVRQPRHRLDRADVMPEIEVHLPQRSPLPHRGGRVGRLVRPHPRVDRVRDGEVLGRAHQVPPRRGPSPGRGPRLDHEPRVGAGEPGRHAPIMRVGAGSLRKTVL